MSRSIQFLAKIEFFLIAGGVFLSILWESFLPYAVFLGAVLGVIRWIAVGQPGKKTPFNLPVLCLMITLGVSLYTTPQLDNSLLLALRLLNGILLANSLLNWINYSHYIKYFLAAFLTLTLVLAGGAFVSVNWVDKFRFTQVISTLLLKVANTLGKTIHPNVMGGILAVCLSGLCAWLVFRWNALGRWERIGLSGALLFVGGVLVLTQSRGALIALAAALVIIVQLRFRRGWMVVTLTVIIVTVWVFQTGPLQIFKSLGKETGGDTLPVREDLWLRANLIVQDFPLTGIGMGNFGDAVNKLYPLGTTPKIVDHAHNIFLQIALDMGIPGLIAWLACYLTVLAMAWQLYRKGDATLRALGVAILCSQVALIVHGLVDCVTWNTRPAVIVWAIWGLTAATWLQLRSISPAAVLAPEKLPASEFFPPIRSNPKTTS